MTIEDLNPHQYPTTGVIDSNLLVLYQRLKQVEALFLESHSGTPFEVTSGLRSPALQSQLVAMGVSTATKSKHLTGSAADIRDLHGLLKAWLKSTPEILVDASLWCEAAESTPGWCHFQIVPPGSGNRWFLP